MDYKDIWNDFCFQIKEKSRNSSEREFQLVVEQLFGKLGWLQFSKWFIKTISYGKKKNDFSDAGGLANEVGAYSV